MTTKPSVEKEGFCIVLCGKLMKLPVLTHGVLFRYETVINGKRRAKSFPPHRR